MKMRHRRRALARHVTRPDGMFQLRWNRRMRAHRAVVASMLAEHLQQSFVGQQITPELIDQMKVKVAEYLGGPLLRPTITFESWLDGDAVYYTVKALPVTSPLHPDHPAPSGRPSEGP